MKFARAIFAFAFCLALAATAAAQSPSAPQASPSGFPQLAQLTTSDNNMDGFGSTIAISGDGNTVAVGIGSSDNGENHQPGGIYVYTKPSSGWTNMTQVAKLTSSELEDQNYFGQTVAISSDGNTIVAGDSAADDRRGVAYVFVKPAGGWTNMTETAQLLGSDAYQSMGRAVAMTMSGNTIVVTATGHTAAAYVFVEPASGWVNMTQTAKLTSSFGTEYSFGGSVAIDGDTIAVGCGISHAYVFVEPANGWTDSTETAQLGMPEGTESDSVAVSGNTVVVGDANFQGSSNYPHGAAFVFVEPADGWKSMNSTATLTASEGDVEEGLGAAVVIQGNQIFAGGGTNNSNFPQGAIYQYIEPATGWKTTSSFNSKTVAETKPASIGASVAFGGNYLAAGAPIGGSGAAYVFGAP
jgi:hypothetical protein